MPKQQDTNTQQHTNKQNVRLSVNGQQLYADEQYMLSMYPTIAQLLVYIRAHFVPPSRHYPESGITKKADIDTDTGHNDTILRFLSTTEQKLSEYEHHKNNKHYNILQNNYLQKWHKYYITMIETIFIRLLQRGAAIKI